MTNNTIMEFADNGIIVRYETENIAEVYEDMNYNDCYQNLNEGMKTIAKTYGGIIANTIDCFDDEIKTKAVGYRVLLEVVPVFDRKKLIPKTK